MQEQTSVDTTQTDRGDARESVTLTAAAAAMAQAAMQREGLKDHALRVAVVGGGCSGFQYSLSFDHQARPDDTVFEQHGVRVFVDATSLQYVRGTVIDYVHGLHGAGFKFVNPNANRTCGCGSSFSA